MRTPQIQNQQNRREHRCHRSDPHSSARNIEVAKQHRAKRDHGRHSSKAADEQVNRNFPRPHWWPNNRLTVITRLARDRTVGDIHTTADNDAIRQSFFTQLINSRFVHADWGAHACSVLVAAFCGDELLPYLFDAPIPLNLFTEVRDSRRLSESPARTW